MGMTEDPSTGVQREMTLDEQLEQHRDLLTRQINYATITERKAEPPVVQEIVLARRHLEDARMRLGVAQALARGLDPFANKVEGGEANGPNS